MNMTVMNTSNEENISNESQWSLSYATGYLHLGMHSKARQELDALAVAIQDEPEVLSLRGRILLAEKRWKETVEFCETARAKHPSVADFFIQEALAYDKLNQPDKARAIWLAAPREIRATAFYHFNLARCEAKLGHFALARQHVKATLSLSPNMRSVLDRDPRLIPFVQDPEMN